MRTSTGEATPASRWPTALSRVLAYSVPAWLLCSTGAVAADGSFLEPGILLKLGIDLGIIAFSVGMVIACLRAIKRARLREATAAEEAERLALSENTLETVLAAEPQALLTLGETATPELLVSNLPGSFGVPRDASLLLAFEQWLDGDSAADLESAMKELAAHGEPFNLMLRTKRGRYVEADGRTAGHTLVLKVRDIAGQRLELAELSAKHKELEEQVAALRLLLDEAKQNERDNAEARALLDTHFRSFDRLATAFAVFDSTQRLAHYNQAYVDLWQLDADWLETRPRDGEILDRLRQARRLEERAEYRVWKQDWLSTYGSGNQTEDRWHLPDGRMLHVIADANSDGGVTYLYENVTEHIALESRYNALTQVQRETLDTLREGVAVFGSDGRLRLYNSAFAAIWCLTPKLLDAEPHVDEVTAWCSLLYNEPDEWDRTRAIVTSIVAERRPYDSQFDRPDGTVLSFAALPLPDGGTLLTYSDITDSKRAERALIEKNEALETTDRLKSDFVSHVSYELRTPLNSMLGFAQMLAEPAFGPLTDKQREYVDDILSSGTTLRAIVDDILDLATIDAGSLRLQLAPVRVSAIIDAARHGVEERLKQNEVQLEIEIEDGVDEVVADASRVTQILYNLLSNAIGFSEPNSVARLTCRRDGPMLAFSVEDEGPGIPEDFQETVFDRFESRTQGSRHRGAGLGLSIVKSLTELHGGTVSLESAPDRGTRLTVLLPLTQDLETPEMEAGPMRATHAG
ncbi:PAS-domain containing protein [Methyloceanibacter sp. wino2]|uniref:PAS-domain containing protein n=1 Tax=Methyloceanibacter sp. wino2 TaxID=2170729 RepID=UPI000D3E49DA|nr:PAS-domain containing protein [Methyloceanibacter sp. wino2]